MNGEDDRTLLAERMRSLVRLQRKLAHDLRGPLNVLGLHLDLLGASLEGAADERQGRYLTTLRRELGTLNQALDRTVSLFRPWDDERERFDGRDVARQAVTLTCDAPRGRTVELVIDPRVTDVPLVGNPAAILHVLLALIALESDRRAGGRLTLRLLEEDGRARFNLEPGESRPGARREPTDEGAEAALQVARSILVAHGGELEIGGSGAAAASLVLPLDRPT